MLYIQDKIIALHFW